MSKTMLQQVMTAPGQIIFQEVPVPVPQKGQVLVRIMKISICGSDIHVYHDKHPFTKYPITQGHEVSGEIAELGEGVIVLASVSAGKVNLLSMVTEQAQKAGAHAGNLIKGIAAIVGGGGGGRPNMAQAGGKNPEKVQEALEEAAKILSAQIK